LVLVKEQALKDKKTDITKPLIMVLQLGIYMIVPIIICTEVGTILTDVFNSKGFAIAGILIGIVAGCNGAYRFFKQYLTNPESPGQRARRLEEEAKAKEESENKE